MDKSIFAFETERLLVRPLQEADKEYYLALVMDVSTFSPALKNSPVVGDFMWDQDIDSEDDVALAVFLKTTCAFVARASFQHIDTGSVEFGFDVVSEYRNLGIATELCKGMIRKSAEVIKGKKIFIWTGVDNAACRRVIEKCGGVFQRYEPTLDAEIDATMMRYLEALEGPTEEQKHQMEEKRRFIEENKEGICRYRFACA